jgi:hypothetical protein
MKGQFSTDIQGRNPNVSLTAPYRKGSGPNALGPIFDFIKQKRRRVTAPLSST